MALQSGSKGTQIYGGDQAKTRPGGRMNILSIILHVFFIMPPREV
jgi:hypothetical protein